MRGWATVCNETRKTSLGDRIQVAERFPQRLRGLLFRDPLRPGEGLLIQPCNSVHTFFMGFPIDVLFLDEEARVIARRHPLPPWRATRIHGRAKRVLELPAGTIMGSGTEIGDRLIIRQGETPPHP